MEKYNFGDNTLLHSVGFDLYKFNNILKTGIVSKNQAEKENIKYSRNYFGYNLDDYISMVRYIYVPDTGVSAYQKYVLNGITFIVEDQDFIFDVNKMHFNYSDEVFVKDKVDVSKIKGIMVSEDYLETNLSNLSMLPLETTSYINIKHTTDNIIRYLKNEGYNCDMQYYEDILREMYFTLQALTKEVNDKDLLNDFKETKYELDYYIAAEVEKCFSQKLNIKNATLGDAIEYINQKNLNLPIYKTDGRTRGML